MHVGYSLQFQNIGGNSSDVEIVRQQLGFADQVEALGFDSVWAPEHHFTNYVLVPNIAQLLTWIGARTNRIQLGSMITVLPWSDPIRTAEQWSWLDMVTKGRALFGMGRGLGRTEFDNFQLNMGESRIRFTEYADAILTGLETGYLEYDGELYKQRRAPIRPLPVYSFKGRVYASAVSPASMEIMARLGVGILIIAQKPWESTMAELDEYRRIYTEINHEEPPKPLLVSYVCVDHSQARAQEMFDQYSWAYARSAVEHYEFANVKLADIPGYEYYGALAETIAKRGIDTFTGFLANLQPHGTPQQVTEELIELQKKVDLGGVIAALSMGGMPAEVAQRNLDTFAADVLPHLKAYPAGGGPRRASKRTPVADALSTPHISQDFFPTNEIVPHQDKAVEVSVAHA
jgi:alkanesulfonate monooxygenase SsuD/methylene tetrahydromethanopterin reductase-like flavin-dependent oxidoreductase (luciferase family)